MLEVGISPKNAAAVKQAATIEPAPNNHGYTSAIFATVGGHRYKLETLNGPRPLYVLTAHEAPTSPNYIILVFEDYTPERISIRDAAIFTNGRTRKETAPRYLRKYSQLAALVHGLISNGATAGPDAAALILAERAAERTEAPAEPAADERPTEAPTRPEEPATDKAPEKTAEKAHRGPAKRYNVYIYTTPGGIRRADIRTTTGRPWLDIPAAELDAIRAEIETNSPGRVSFTITEEPTTEPAAAPGSSTPETGAEDQQTAPETDGANAGRIDSPQPTTAPATMDAETIPGRVQATPPQSASNRTRARYTDRAKGPTAPADVRGLHNYTRRHLEPYRATQNRIRAYTEKPT